MRNINCRSVRREIEEVAPGKWLSAGVNNHVSTCVACEKLLREQKKLRELIGTLGTVTAPDDFDFRLRARLADEKRAAVRYLSFSNLSFGFRSAAVAMMLMLVVSALMFVSFRSRSVNPESTTMANNPASNPGNEAAKPAIPAPAANPAPAVESGAPVVAIADNSPAPKRRNTMRQSDVAYRSNDSTTQGQTAARVLRRDQLAGLYSDASFPIDASYQSLKVSLDDGRSTRTISLPAVSFGSQRSLSSNANSLMASARGAW